MRWWITIGIVLLIGALVLTILWNKRGWLAEGFQATGLPATNEQVYEAFPDNSENTLTRGAATILCGKLGARLANSYELEAANRAGLSVGTGWVRNRADPWTVRNGAAVATSATAGNAFCYGVKANAKPTGITIVNPSFLAPGTTLAPVISLTDLPILANTVADSTNSYTIYDVSPVYTQLDISQLEFSKYIDELTRSEGELVRRGFTELENFRFSNDPGIMRIYYSYWLDPNKSNKNDDLGYLNTTSQRIQSAFDLVLFSAHPMGYMLSGTKARPTRVNEAPIYIAEPGMGYSGGYRTPADFAVFGVQGSQLISTTYATVSFWTIFDKQNRITHSPSRGQPKDTPYWDTDTIYEYLRQPTESFGSGTVPSRLSATFNYCPNQDPPYSYDGNWLGCISSGKSIGGIINSEKTRKWFTPSQILKNVAADLTERAVIPNYGITSSFSWRPVLQRGDIPDAQTILDTYLRSKGTQPLFWRGISYRGTISQTNRDEINKSISYSIYFNFSDPTYVERQIRISSDPPYELYMSPDFNAVPEFKGEVPRGTNTYIIKADPDAKINNAAHCAIKVTPEMLSYIPYRARNYITRWANTRHNRVLRFFNTAGALNTSTLLETATIIQPKPTRYDMLSPRDVSTSANRTFLLPAEKQAIMEKMAQLYYDLANQTSLPQVRIKKFLDVYNVGDTIFDARYIISQKSNQQTVQAVSTLTGRYEAARGQPMTQDDLLSLELKYQEEVKKLYEEEAANVDGSAQGCGLLPTRRIRISAANPGSTLQLSQVLVYTGEGENVAGTAALKTFSTMNLDFFGAGYTMSSMVYDYSQQLLEGQDKADRILLLNNALAQEKLALIIDGTAKPRFAPNIYKSNWTVAEAGQNLDFVELDLGSEYDVTAVKLVQPIGRAEAYSVRLSDFNASAAVSTIVSTQTATFKNPSASFLCQTDSLNRFRVARFYADIQPHSGTPDITKLTFTGFTEDSAIDDCAALTFNPKYNGGFTNPIDEATGNQVYAPKIKFTQNNAFIPMLDCANPETQRRILTEYSLSQQTDSFRLRPDIVALNGTPNAYTTDTHSFVPSSITGFKQISPDKCGISWNEVKVAKTTNAYEATIPRWAEFSMKADTENWLSPNRTYDVSASRIYTSNTPGIAAAAPVNLPIPVPVRAVLDTAGGACPEKRCSDTDVIDGLVKQYNERLTGTTILRVNKAITVNAFRCDYEAVFGTTTGSFTSTIAMGTMVNPVKCEVQFVSTIGTIGQGNFVTGTTPFLTRIYTYVTDALKSAVNLFTETNAELTALAAAHAPLSQDILKTYRGDSLAAYGALKQLDGCRPTDTTNRCSNPQILDSFIERYRDIAPGKRLTRILRAGAASGTECDFTVETTDLGANGASAAPMTRGLRCSMKQLEGLGCAFGLADGQYQAKEAYVLPGSFSRQEAGDACKARSGVLATTDQLMRASTLGAAWTDVGWVADRASTITVQGATATGPGAAICYGIKPAAPAARPFNAQQYTQPVSILGPCMELMPQPPTPADFADMGIQQTTASPTASLSSIMASTTTTVAPYVVGDAAISPLDYIACGDAYARTLMGGVASATSVTFSSCQANGQTFVFQKDPVSKLYTLPNRPEPSLPSPSIPDDATCQRLGPLTGLGSQIRAAKRVDGATCEYRVSSRDDLPFGTTYRRAKFYAEGTPKLLSLRPATPIESPFTYRPALDSVLRTPALLEQLGLLAKKTWNELYDTIPASESNYRQRLGVITATFLSPDDALIFRATSADIGPLGNNDIRAYYPDAYFTTVFRKPFTSTDITTTTGTLVYSITRSFTAPVTASVQQTIGDDETIVTTVAASLVAGSAYSFRLLRLRNTGSTPLELYRFNVFRGSATSESIVGLNYARVSLTDTTFAPLLSNTVSLSATGQCPSGYRSQVDPVSKFTLCQLDTTLVPAGDRVFYSYSPPAGMCRMGYDLSGGVCRLSYTFQELLESIYTSSPSSESRRLTLEAGQGIVIDFKEYVQLDGYLLVGGKATNGKWIVEGSNNGTTWAEVSRVETTLGTMEIKGYLWGNRTASVTPPTRWTTVVTLKEQFRNPPSPWPSPRPIQQRAELNEEPSPSPSYRLSWLRFRWLDTGKFVSMSVLRFYTADGEHVNPATMRLSNLGGSRRSASEGPDALLADTAARRWVDYNKQHLVIRLDPLPTEQIVAFRFSKPAEGQEGVPTRWILEGSRDGRSWATLQEQRTPIRMLDLTTPYIRLGIPI